jgi:proteic killer suppression protein
MIPSFRDKRTAELFSGAFVRQFQGFAVQAERRLAVLNVASSIHDLAALRSNRLEALKGDREGQFSIRINDQWRIWFEWPSGSTGPANVEIVDYH